MFCWGKCSEGQLGVGETEQEFISTPRLLENLEFSSNVREVSCGWNHTAFLCKDGTVYTCGSNEFGQLGQEKSHTNPESVHAIETFTITKVTCGKAHTVAVSDQGLVFAWGDNSYGQIGLGSKVKEKVQTIPKMLKGLAKMSVVQIACGCNHSMALTISGHLFCWGDNSSGQLGIGKTHSSMSEPAPVLSLNGVPFMLISAGGAHSFALSSSGALFGWGKNEYGQLGVHDTTDRPLPTLLKSLRSQGVCYVSCGEKHTAVLTSDGGVFTFGCGTSGQLGHNSNHHEYTPRKVFELMGSVVTQIACGRAHTLALVPSSGRVYTFGRGGDGQLGLGVTNNCNSPMTAKGPWLRSNNIKSMLPEADGDSVVYTVRRIDAGGDHCFAMASSYGDETDGPEDMRLPRPSQSILHLSVPVTMDLVKRATIASDLSDVSEKLEIIFSSLACLNGSFLDNVVHPYVMPIHPCLIPLYVHFIHSHLTPLPPSQIVSCISNFLLPAMVQQQPPDIEALRVYLMLPENGIMLDKECFMEVVIPFADSILRLSPEAQKVLRRWWSTLPSTYFSRVIQVFQECVKYLLTLPLPHFANEERQVYLGMCMVALDNLHKVNNESGDIVPFKQFTFPRTREVDIRADYFNWIQNQKINLKHQHSVVKNTFSFCRFPFVFDASAKTKLLQTDAVMQMQSAVDEVNRRNVQSLLSFVPVNPVNPCLVIKVRRDSIVQDTLTQITTQSPYDLKKPLKVIFANEEAVDAGGVKKEFFLLLLTEILDPKYGMFTYLEDSQTIWFNDLTFEESPMFLLIGVICGLAIYNSTIFDLRFPPVLYKKLLRKKPNLDDFRGFQPSVARNLQYLLDYSDDDLEDTFGLNFQIMREKYGALEYIDLVPGGGEVPVTQDNREQYVELYIDYYLSKAVDKQFEAFFTGFHRVCGGHVLEFFHPQELMEMVVGCQEYDFEVLEKITEYKGEYYRKHPVIANFWTVFYEFPLSMKKKFLAFLTGSDRVPILGMESMKMIIQPVAGGEHGDHLPVAHTCFNLLDLPRYPTLEMMRTKLSQAVEFSKGFGLA
ncbi:predicted protein [Nematostella vectensis]|uniref:HECT domain-containing protein n=1 Tax=Nematostella vectensis TaxID=45351 RepID=A7SNX9_NEMVE|nr:predicted protein [Nematostella vectensis]|eukprot:XP_001626692.1 predicted protein [Nematostella vectensis]